MIHRPEFLSGPDREAVEDTAAAYALDALEPDETRVFRDHLAGCPLCQTIVAEFSDTIDMLSSEADAIEATPAARDALIAQAEKIRPLRPTRWYRQPTAILAAVAAVVAIAFGTRALGLQSDLTNAQADTAQARVAATQAANSIAERDQVLALLTAGGKVVPISAASYNGSVILPAGNEPPLFIAGLLPATTSNQVFQVWAIMASGPKSVGVFSAGTSIVHLTGPLTGATRLAITVEPGPAGSPAPTSPPFLTGSL